MSKQMRKVNILQIHNITFASNTELIEYVKNILHKYNLNEFIDIEDRTFLSCLLQRHPEYVSKVGSGIEEMFIKLDGRWKKTRCFHILRTDKSQTDFSYLKCISNNISGQPLKMFKDAARTAVKNQVLTYLINHNRKTIDSNGTVVCEKTRQRIPKEVATVDHTPPKTFDKIVSDFIQIKNINLFVIEYDGLGDNQYHKQFKSQSLSDEFSAYHKITAKLRVISKAENLSQKKKGHNEQLSIAFQ